MRKKAECEEAVWSNIVTGNSTLTVGLVYRSPNISIDENEKVQNAIKEVSKRDCIIMGDFNHGRIQWKSLQSTGSEDQKFKNLVQDSFLTQHVLEPTRGENVLIMSRYVSHWGVVITTRYMFSLKYKENGIEKYGT